MTFVVREATALDLDSVVEIFSACWHESYKELLSENVRSEMTTEKARELWLPAFASTDKRETLLALLNNQPIGVASIGSNPEVPDRGHLFSLYIHPKYAGKGFGKALLSGSIARLESRGLTPISLWVFKTNLGAQGLYKKSGFEFTDRERTDERWGSPEIEMRRVNKALLTLQI